MSYSRVYQSIYSREWIAVFGVGLIEIREVYAHPPFSIGLLNHNDICQLIEVIHFSDEIYLKQLSYFLGNGFVPLLSKYSFLLPDWGECGWYIQFVNHDCGVDPWHILMTPGKHVLIVS